ncbi:required for excision 1-B domain-containing protein-like [Branchiostoma lanceolatum]|uniref:required for excision 1-B domain-containing protein-like n=1 Tax=Branchiostoma lanceolatum TaxID=7740 RepID=UPI0034561DA0
MGSECQQLIRKFYGLQEERIKVYRRFQEGFETYLDTSPNYDFAPYRQLVHDVTQEFQRISSDVMAIRDRLRDDHNQVELVTLLENIQEEEKKKLQLTAELQVARQVEIDNGDVDHYKEEVTQVKKRLQQSVTRICEHMDDLKFESEDL